MIVGRTVRRLARRGQSTPKPGTVDPHENAVGHEH
jgi:hypothetical protein